MKTLSKSRLVRAIAWAFVPAAIVLAGCGGYLTVDGYDAAYVDVPPPGIEVYPRYAVGDGYVYDVNGAYYHQHGERWVRYRSAPREVVRGREVRGPAERQR